MLKGYGAVILDGAWLTLQLALSSMALAIVLGLIGVALRLSPVRWLAWLGDLYSTVIRGIPDLVLILLIFYGGQDLLNRVAPMLGYDDYIDLNPLAAGIGTLGFIFGAYLSETFRGAFMAIPKGQAEAAYAVGMTRTQAQRQRTARWQLCVERGAEKADIAVLEQQQRQGLDVVVEVAIRLAVQARAQAQSPLRGRGHLSLRGRPCQRQAGCEQQGKYGVRISHAVDLFQAVETETQHACGRLRNC